MKIGSYSVKLNYGILRGFIDVMGLLMLYLIYQTTYAFVDANLNPDMVLANIFLDGVPVARWLPGLIFPVIALCVSAFSVVYMFIPHKAPKSFRIDGSNAQKYYDAILMANSLTRVVILLGLWDYTYIHQSNIMFASESWISFQAIMDIVVCALIIFITRRRIAAFAACEERNSQPRGGSEDVKIKRR